MTVDQALSQGLLAKLKAAPLCRDGAFRFAAGRSQSQNLEYWAILSEATGAVEIRSLGLPGGEPFCSLPLLRTIPDDIEWDVAE